MIEVKVDNFKVNIGDMPDDMIAAKKSAAGYKAVGLILAAPHKESLAEELKRAGADTIIEDFEQLKQLIGAV